MSTFSGIGGRGDKGSNKYKSLNINNIYQGKSVPTQKSTGNHNFYVINVWECWSCYCLHYKFTWHIFSFDYLYLNITITSKMIDKICLLMWKMIIKCTYMYKSQKDFLQPISEFQWEIWLFCFHWLNCSFHSFLGNFSPRRGFENLINKQGNIYPNWIANGGQFNFTENWVWKELLFTLKAHSICREFLWLKLLHSAY